MAECIGDNFAILVRQAQDGDLSAMISIYSNYLDFQDGAAKQKEALVWLHKAGELSEPEAEYKLGFLYEHGEGVPKNDLQAFRWYQRSAEHNYVEAQFSLGYSYEHGKGVNQNHLMAVVWYQKAAEQGLGLAQNNLGVLYELGLGVEQNFQKAQELYHSADASKHLTPVWSGWVGPNIGDKISPRPKSVHQELSDDGIEYASILSLEVSSARRWN